MKKAAEAPPPPPDGAVPGRDAVPGRRRASEPGKGNAAEEADGGPADGEGMEAETTAARGGSDWPVGGLDEDEPGRPIVILGAKGGLGGKKGLAGSPRNECLPGRSPGVVLLMWHVHLASPGRREFVDIRLEPTGALFLLDQIERVVWVTARSGRGRCGR